LSNLGQGKVSVLIEAVNNTRAATQGATADLERLRRARLDASRVVLEEQRTQRFLTQAYRAQHQEFMNTVSVMRTVGSIGRSVLGMWQAYTIGQMHVSESLKNVEEAQIAVNTALELYGANSVVYQDAVSDLEDLEKAAEKAKGNESAGLIGLGLTAVGVAAQVGTLAAKLGLVAETAALAAGALIPFILGGMEMMAPGDTPTPMSDLLPFDVTKDQFLQGGGGSYEDAYAEWRNQQMAQGPAITINQVNYGVEGYEETVEQIIAYLEAYYAEG
jgi:hypothetical protein